MTTIDFITELFCRVDDAITNVQKHSQANLCPSETVTLGLLFAFKGGSTRAFHRWVQRDLAALFPRLPERTRLFRLLARHQDWTRRFLALPTILGVIDSYGIELVHPIRERAKPERGRIATKGKSNFRWIMGAKVAVVLNQFGLVVDFDVSAANVGDTTFRPLIEKFREQMLILCDKGFHAKEGDPANLKVCQKGKWNDRMVVETCFSMLTNVCHIKKMGQRAWTYLRARLAYTLAMFNLLAQWDGLRPDENGFVPLTLARFSL
jgi:hypothetical protein